VIISTAERAVAHSDWEDEEHHAWLWVAAAAGLALGVAGMVWLLRYRDPARSMSRLLQRCQDRIKVIESSLSDLESAFRSGPSG
jgi:hypothetical protein